MLKTNGQPLHRSPHESARVANYKNTGTDLRHLICFVSVSSSVGALTTDRNCCANPAMPSTAVGSNGPFGVTYSIAQFAFMREPGSNDEHIASPLTRWSQ